MVIYLSRGQNDAEVSIQFPAEPDVVWPIITQLDEHSISAEPVKIVGAYCPIPNLTQYIACADLEQEADIRKLNALNRMIDSMGEHDQHILSGALDAESINGLDDVLRVASSLDQYEFIQGVTSDKELGGWLVEQGLAGVDFPEAVRPYLDYAGIGAEYCASHGGAYTPNGYVKRREMVPEQAVAENSKFALTLISASGTYRIDLPTSDDELEQARQALRLRSIGQAFLSDAKIDYPWAHLLPLDSIILADANTLAQFVQQMSESELRVYGAALEVEELNTFLMLSASPRILMITSWWTAMRVNMAGKPCGMRGRITKYWKCWTVSPILTRWAGSKWSRTVCGKPAMGRPSGSVPPSPGRRSRAK